MKNIKESRALPVALSDALGEFGLTMAAVDMMEDREFYELCAQLGRAELEQLRARVKNPRWEAHIWSVIDNAMIIGGRRGTFPNPFGEETGFTQK